MRTLWLMYVPGSAATTIESLIRKFTDLPTLKIQTQFQPDIDLKKFTSHHMKKQFQPNSIAEMARGPEQTAELNFCSPNFPCTDGTGPEQVDWINRNSKPGDVKVYLGPHYSINFSLLTSIKSCDTMDEWIRMLLPGNDVSKWNSKYASIEAMEKWELREYLSLNLFEWWTDHMTAQFTYARDKKFKCYDTFDVFLNVGKVATEIITALGGNIIDFDGFYRYCDEWTEGQTAILDQYAQYDLYRNDILNNHDSDVIINNIVLEALIQSTLRDNGIELKCFGLNEFPNPRDLKSFMEKQFELH